MKKLLTLIVVLSLLTAIFPLNAYASESGIIRNDETGIPDKGLYNAVLKALNKKSGTFTKTEVASIIRLEANNYDKKIQTSKALKG